MKHRVTTTASYFDLVETFPEPGCAICNLLLRLTDRLLQSTLYERWLDQETHSLIRARRGLCSVHSHGLTQYRGNVQTVTIFYKTAVDEAVEVLEGMREDLAPGRIGLSRVLGGRRSGAELAARLSPRAQCIICEALDGAESRYADVMAETFHDERLQAAYQQSDGLCLPHTQIVLAASSDPGVQREIIDTQARIWRQLRNDLAEFLAKTDATHRYGELGERQAGSWRRATTLLAGAHPLFGVDPRSRWLWARRDKDE